MNELCSTREMARLCAVNESTIKRWADSGRLRCIKTPGGHRKFRIRDVLWFLNEYGFEGLGVDETVSSPDGAGALVVQILHRDWDSLSSAYLEIGRKESSPDVVPFLFQLVSGGCTLVEICDRIMVIQDGTMKAFDTPDRLKASNDFYREALILSGMA